MNSPTVTVLTAVHDPEPAHLAECLGSVASQTMTSWEHVVVDDGSSDRAVIELLAAAERRGEIRVVRRSESGGIVAASNDGLAVARGEFVAFLDHDDLLEPRALALMLAALEDSDAAYSDHDFIRPDGRYSDPCYKPDFSPERLRSQNYITHFVVARLVAIERVGGLREQYEGAQDHDLILRLGEQGSIAHVPSILYHWRRSSTSVSGGGAKPWAFEAGRNAIADHCRRIGRPSTIVATGVEGCSRVVPDVDQTPTVSVIVPTRGSSGRVWGATRVFVVDAIESIEVHSTLRPAEYVVVADTPTAAPVRRALAELLGSRLTLVEYDEDFNFSVKMNLGASHASGDLLLLLNDDTELIEPRSIESMAAAFAADARTDPAVRDNHGALAMLGAKLLYSDGTLQHGGHVYHHDLMHALHGWDGDSPGPGPMHPLAVERECSGVTAAAAMVRADLFRSVGGFATELPLNYNDVDLSLKLRAAGHRVTWTPWASWYHFESRTRHSELLDDEYQFINQRWHYEINNDPYYNPNLLPDRADWLERPLRSGAPPVETRPNLVRRLTTRRPPSPDTAT
jgi:glycosyltransferase involved in cell wall biosynthesis